MDQQIFDTEHIKYVVTVDKELLDSVYSIVSHELGEPAFYAEIECGNRIRYRFSNYQEMIGYSNNMPLDIKRLCVRFGEQFRGDRIEIEFNSFAASIGDRATVNYSLASEAQYTTIKNRIDQAFSSKKASYSLLTRFPIISLITAACFALIYVTTLVNNIVFPEWVQATIWFAFFIGVSSAFWPIASCAKRKILPLVDFRLGISKARSERMSTLRDRIIWGLFIALMIGILSSIVGSRLV